MGVVAEGLGKGAAVGRGSLVEAAGLSELDLLCCNTKARKS